MKQGIIILLVGLVAGIGYQQQWFSRDGDAASSVSEVAEIAPRESAHRTETVTIESGVAYSELLESAGVATSVHTAVRTSAEDVYDLSLIRAGDTIELTYDHETDDLIQLMYQTDTQHELYVTRSTELVTVEPEDGATTTPETVERVTWTAEKRPIPYDVRTKTVSGTIDSSLYEAGLEQDMDERAIIALAEVFQWTIDFAWGVRVGDTFKVIYEERWRDGEYVMPGKILAARYVNDRTSYDAYYFQETEDNTGYFDEEGNSVQKIFLKAPLEFKYISSGFTTRSRFVSNALGWTRDHRAIDYAASSGTPVRAVGAGTVVSAGWNTQGYGNLVTIRHNETYTTNYAHLSRMYVQRGERVTQGEVIGAVGSTGFSTGPHLHYEMVKFGTKINPLTEVLPAGTAISSEHKERFFEHIKQYQSSLLAD